MPRRICVSLLHGVVVLALPIVLIVASIQLVADYWYLDWEYNRAGFPEDPYGLTTDERIAMATVCIHYLTTNEDLSELSSLQLPEGGAAFNARELSHMADVQRVYRGVALAGIIAAMAWVAAVAGLLWLDRSHRHLPAALVTGSALTLVIPAAIGAYMAVDWTSFFTAFHGVFFEGQSWIFEYSDTLIRL